MMPLSVAEADDELLKAVALEQEIQEELSQLETRLAEVESTAGERCLAARKAGDTKQIQKINDEVLKLRNQYEVTSKTLQAARVAIKEARREINMAEGRDLRAQAAEIIAVINDRQEKTARLLAELQEHEGIHFVPEPEVDPSGAIIPGRYAVSGTAKLCMDADARLRQAATTEGQIVRVEPDPPRDGHKSGAVHSKG